MFKRQTGKISCALAAIMLLGLPARAENKSPAAPKAMHLTKAQLAKYYKIYQDPSVRQLRQTFDSYLKGKCEPLMANALKEVSKDYYKSKFVVLAVDPAMFGGDFLTIIFQDKPDKVFVVWMYKVAKDAYEFRSIDKRKMTDDQLQAMKTMYRPFLTDKAHAI